MWLGELESRVEEALETRGTATGAQLSGDEPGLRTLIPARTKSERPQAVTSPLLTIMNAEGRLVRSTPTGPWTSHHHRWEPIERWWPEGMPTPGTEEAQRALAHRWLTRFGPATIEDLQWWTGWNKTTVRHALDRLPVEEVDLHGEVGITLVDDTLYDDLEDDGSTTVPVAALLPTLDSTPMGWKERDWQLGIDQHHVFDRAGNIGPTLWWDGEIIGSWAITPTGDNRTVVVADRGAQAHEAIGDAVARLHGRLNGTVVTPAFRTALERSLVQGSNPLGAADSAGSATTERALCREPSGLELSHPTLAERGLSLPTVEAPSRVCLPTTWPFLSEAAATVTQDHRREDALSEPDAAMAEVGRGIELGQRGEREAARQLFVEVWNQIGGEDGDPFHRCALAHSMADVQDDVNEELVWDRRALAAADLTTDARLHGAGVTSPVAAFYPSLHLNLGECYRKLGQFEHAREHLERGREAEGALADDGYGRMIGCGLDRLAERLALA